MAQTILEALKGINPYPIPFRTLSEVADRRDIDLTGEADKLATAGRTYRLAIADLFLWLAFAPDITQGGQSYSFTDAQRTEFKNKAYAVYDELKDSSASTKTIYGYKGSKL